MRTPLLFEKIEAYLTGQMPREEARLFEQKIAADQELAEEVKLQRLELDFLDFSLEENLKAKMTRWKDEPPPNPFPESLLPPTPPSKHPAKPWLVLFGAVVVILGGLWIVLNLKGEKQQVIPSENPPDTIQHKPEQKNTPPVASEQTPQQEPEEENNLLASAFQENQFMEDLIRSGARGKRESVLRLHFISPPQGTQFRPDKNGEATVHFVGNVENARPGEDLSLNLLFFKNKDINRPLLIMPVPLTADSSGRAGFDFDQHLSFQQGLYYYTIEMEESQKTLWAGKFIIR